MVKYILSVGATASLLTLAFSPAPATAATNAVGCQLAGSATFSPGLTATGGNFNYNFTTSMTGCQSTDLTAPSTGTFEAGKTWSYPYSWSYIDSTGDEQSGTGIATYQEPVPLGNGGCASSTTWGVGFAKWTDGTTTVIQYSTSGATTALSLSGSVIPSMSLGLVSYTGPTQAPPPSSYTVSTTRFAGDKANGLLSFQPSDPTLCATTGASAAAVTGTLSLSSTT